MSSAAAAGRRVEERNFESEKKKKRGGGHEKAQTAWGRAGIVYKQRQGRMFCGRARFVCESVGMGECGGKESGG